MSPPTMAATAETFVKASDGSISHGGVMATRADTPWYREVGVRGERHRRLAG
jgi:hypothetical protein